MKQSDSKKAQNNPSGIEQKSFEKIAKITRYKAADNTFFGRWLDKLIKPSNHKDWVIDAKWEQIQQEPAQARKLLYTIVLSILLLIVWAGFAKLDEVTRGEGKIIPSQQLQVVQSYDGGMIENILVTEGQVVEAGDLLLEIDPTRFMANLRENQTQYYSLSAEVIRLKALTSHTEPIFPEDLLKKSPQSVKHEKLIYQSNLEELKQQIEISAQQLEQKQQDLNEALAAKEQYTSALKLVQKELSVTKPLLKSGAVSDMDIIRLERQIIELEGGIKKSQALISKSRSAVEEAKNKIRETELSAINRWNNQLSETLIRLDSLRESESGLADKVAQTAIRSPVRGTIQRLMVNTVGGVVQPGSNLVEIIPLDDQLIVEAKISPKDIAFLRAGQTAMVKFTAYDFTIYGGLTAELIHISPDTITDDKDNTFYLVRLKTQAGKLAEQFSIIPGMTTQVDIITGKKTILEYLLKPILRATSQAMTER
ncbi:HlyD family type I secretion periplasmic adaptor subunit [Catenovulum sp. 2E275]|uniref:HlyD family type I secretion periplasmic adaptor subunit n=1 Tax=Catenovulum sp. 2E275 TaxID=2980497 RepID=UPI0021D30035|nr:HlyD family type I secretion periplasmic adaptor subunit [Catenovulum sp. 2E275]MCU4676841.1 HlyD family type I secretion periplasmic adaptor subunit [Catenovulum sp. 2E275]